MPTILGITSSMSFGSQLGHMFDQGIWVSFRPNRRAAFTCIKCERWVATTVGQSTTV